jgi:chromosome segregation ATPase
VLPPVNQVNLATETNLQDPERQVELQTLRQALAQRDQLIEQYSKALYAQIRQPEVPSAHQTQPELEQQLGLYQQQLSDQTGEITHLRETQQQLINRNQMLEKVIQELPQVYRQKFADRLSQVKAKMEALQRENRQLQTDLHQINYILSGRGRSTENLALPQVIGQQAGEVLPGQGEPDPGPDTVMDTP